MTNKENFAQAADTVSRDERLKTTLRRRFGVPLNRIPERDYIRFLSTVYVDESKEGAMFLALCAYAKYGASKRHLPEAIGKALQNSRYEEHLRKDISVMLRSSRQVAMIKIPVIMKTLKDADLSADMADFYNDLLVWDVQTRKKWAREIARASQNKGGKKND